LGAKVSDIKIEKFRDLTQYHKDKYELAGKFSIPILKTITNKFSPQVIFTIVLPNQAISSIDVLSECNNLIILNLSHNSIENISCLQSCPQLRIANLADNSINNLDGLGKCHELVNLHLEGNMIKGVGQI
jgi:Leucine-rich repeat (LRR) protein